MNLRNQCKARSDVSVFQKITNLQKDPNHIEDEPKVLRDTAVENLAKRTIARDLAINPEQLTVIGQPDYHIDVYLRLGPTKNSLVLLLENAGHRIVFNRVKS